MSDQRMPEMSGVEMLHHARQLRPDATRLLFHSLRRHQGRR